MGGVYVTYVANEWHVVTLWWYVKVALPWQDFLERQRMKK